MEIRVKVNGRYCECKKNGKYIGKCPHLWNYGMLEDGNCRSCHKFGVIIERGQDLFYLRCPQCLDADKKGGAR